MNEERLIVTLVHHGVDFMQASASQTLPPTPEGDEAIIAHIFFNDAQANRIELVFALRELNAQMETDEGELCELPNDPDWLLLAPAHCVRVGPSTVFLFRSFPGLDEPYPAIKNRAELVIRTSGEMHYRMSMDDKLRFMRAFEKQEGLE
jgi:hypothetical protein